MASTRRALRWANPPHQARSQATLDRLLDSAETLFAEKGYEDTGVAEIARHAGSSVGAFYTRFDDKEALLNALYDRFVEQALFTGEAVLSPERWADAPVSEILAEIAAFLVRTYRERRGLLRTFVGRARQDAEFARRQRRYLEALEAQVRALMASRAAEIPHPDPERAGGLALAVGMSALQNGILFEEGAATLAHLPDDELAHEIVAMQLAYLGLEDASSTTYPYRHSARKETA